MGLMNKLNKMKSFLFDDVEEEKEIIKTKRKEKKPEIEEKQENDDIEELFFEDTIEEEKEEIKPRSTKVEKEFNFPEFDDQDFMVPQRSEPEIVPVKKEEPKRDAVPLYQGSKRKEETKRFKPSPIISPIYGLLDSEGNMIKEEHSKDLLSASDNDEMSFDEVRKKAYGSLDESFDDTIKNLSSKTIEEAEKEMEEKELSRSKKEKQKEEKEEIKVKDNYQSEDDDDDDMILPNVSFKEIDVDKETKKEVSKTKKVEDQEEDDDDDDTKEQDLFNLIDTMYQKEGDEE